MSNFVIKPCYTTAELNKLLGFNKSETTKRFLVKLKIPFQTTGKKDFWMLSDIKSFCPSLFDSILESVGLNEMIASKPVMEVDEEFYSELNFK